MTVRALVFLRENQGTAGLSRCVVYIESWNYVRHWWKHGKTIRLNKLLRHKPEQTNTP